MKFLGLVLSFVEPILIYIPLFPSLPCIHRETGTRLVLTVWCFSFPVSNWINHIRIFPRSETVTEYHLQKQALAERNIDVLAPTLNCEAAVCCGAICGPSALHLLVTDLAGDLLGACQGRDLIRLHHKNTWGVGRLLPKSCP